MHQAAVKRSKYDDSRLDNHFQPVKDAVKIIKPSYLSQDEIALGQLQLTRLALNCGLDMEVSALIFPTNSLLGIGALICVASKVAYPEACMMNIPERYFVGTRDLSWDHIKCPFRIGWHHRDLS